MVSSARGIHKPLIIVQLVLLTSWLPVEVCTVRESWVDLIQGSGPTFPRRVQTVPSCLQGYRTPQGEIAFYINVFTYTYTIYIKLEVFGLAQQGWKKRSFCFPSYEFFEEQEGLLPRLISQEWQQVVLNYTCNCVANSLGKLAINYQVLTIYIDCVSKAFLDQVLIFRPKKGRYFCPNIGIFLYNYA